MVTRLVAFVVWALVAATVVFWAMRLLSRPQPAPAFTVAVGDAAAQRGDLARLLGATPVASAAAAPVPELASRFKLLGVMASRQAEGGYALIAVDAKPARAYAVGAPLDGELVLQSVSLRSAKIGPAQGGAAVQLDVPPLPTATTGTLPSLPTDSVKFGAAASEGGPPAGPAPIGAPAVGPAPIGSPDAAPPPRPAGAATR